MKRILVLSLVSIVLSISFITVNCFAAETDDSNAVSSASTDKWKIEMAVNVKKITVGKSSWDNYFIVSRHGEGYPSESGKEDAFKDIKRVTPSVTSKNKSIIAAICNGYSNLGGYTIYAKSPGAAKITIKCTIVYKTGEKKTVSKTVKVKAVKGKAKKKKYQDGYKCIVSGDYAYCTNGHRLFKVNIKNHKVKVLTTIKDDYRGCIDHLVQKGDYIYYSVYHESGWMGALYRINKQTGKKKRIAKNVRTDFAVVGKTVYYYKEGKNQPKAKKMKMSLSGGSKKKTSYNVTTKVFRSNSCRAEVWNDTAMYGHDDKDGVNYYLETYWGDQIFLEHLAHLW